MTTEADIRVPLNRDFSDNGEVPPRIAALFFTTGDRHGDYFGSRSRISLAGSSMREKAKRDFPRSFSDAPT